MNFVLYCIVLYCIVLNLIKFTGGKSKKKKKNCYVLIHPFIIYYIPFCESYFFYYFPQLILATGFSRCFALN